MSGSFHSYNTEPANFNFQAENYASPYGKIAGVGCDGTKSGVDATLSKYSSPFVGGSTGYSFTDVPVGPVAGPNAPYSIIDKYDDNNTKFRNDFAPQFPAAFKGGKSSRKKIQYGCNRKTRGGKKRSQHKRSQHKRSKHKHTKKCSKKCRTMRRQYKRSKHMRGGMLSSASDYTAGRDTSQDQPYGNKAYSFGQGLTSTLSANESALASPPPFLPYNDCGKVIRS